MMMTTTPLTQTAGRALVDLIAALRPEWDRPGVETAVRNANTTGQPGILLAQQALAVTADPACRTPALIGRSARHWPLDTAGRPTVTPEPPRHCRHHDHPHPCRTCADGTRPPSASDLAALKAAVRGAAE